MRREYVWTLPISHLVTQACSKTIGLAFEKNTQNDELPKSDDLQLENMVIVCLESIKWLKEIPLSVQFLPSDFQIKKITLSRKQLYKF